MKKLSAAVVAVCLALSGSVSPAFADDYGVHIYMSAPKVQGPPMTSNRTIETFDSYTAGECPAALSIGNLTGRCTVSAANAYGGASSTTAGVVTGGVGTKYASTVRFQGDITVNLATPAKYLGLWWSAGSTGNSIDFYSNNTRVAHMDVGQLMTVLSNPTVAALDSTSYTTSQYYGNPVNGLAAGEPFLFLSAYSVGGTTFNKIVLSGNGFEFDNITVSALDQTVDQSLVDIQFIPGEAPPGDPDPVTAPESPTNPTVTKGDGEATISWTAPTGGGDPTGYTVTSKPDGLSCTAVPPDTQCTITGLTNGKDYTFTVTAENDAGSSDPSAQSDQVVLGGEVGGEGTLTVYFSSISANLSNGSKSAIATYLRDYAPTNVTCTGSTQGNRAIQWLAKARAENVCKYAKTINRKLHAVSKVNAVVTTRYTSRSVLMASINSFSK